MFLDCLSPDHYIAYIWVVSHAYAIVWSIANLSCGIDTVIVAD